MNPHEISADCKCDRCDKGRYALAAGIVMAIEKSLSYGASAAEILDENSPIRDAIREFMELMPQPDQRAKASSEAYRGQ